MALTWFDAHLDLACLAVCGRDMLAPLDELHADGAARAGPWAPPAVTLPALVEGRVRFALATVFTEAVRPEPGGAPLTPEQYPAGDAARAHAVGRAQLEVYLTWRDAGHVLIDVPRVLRAERGVGEVRAGMGVSEVVPVPLERRVARLAPTLHLGVLIEGADPVREPDELGWWAQRGVCAVGLAWARGSRYAGGNTDAHGLTDLGRALVRRIDELGLVHDLSHLSDAAMDELLEASDGRVIASHSNCRALLGGGGTGENQRHLRDESIRRIVRRGGVIGLNLFVAFLRAGLTPGGDERATIEEAVGHVERVCELAGHRRAVGLGSDMDGGFSARRLPIGIDRPRDLARLGEALAARGWSDDEVADFAWRNWARFWAGPDA